MRLILTAHGSADPRSAETTHAVAERVRALRPGLDVRVAFCEQNSPNLRDALHMLDGPAVVTPLLLASAYHARIDIPAMIADAGADVIQADTLGEDPRLIAAMRERLAENQIHRYERGLGVLVVAVGSSHAAANARTSAIADTLARGTRWSGVQVAYATGPHPSVLDGIDRLRHRGARRIVMAPWFIAPGRITDRVAAIADAADISMVAPLGAHPLVAETVLDRFDAATADSAAAA
ncbi:sirohydrochlorin chelatase [Mycobacterium sp. CVI_P3]|uniref:Sirohydrochlorin chelatase n=1 Tax=Mycobacterium pinniadriaticum TaxID=2994102 RepID=A0ABT3SD40_9MYCO|nr:sirohydrochlorin chelatase [Mycobacterium pinniadriaticum]MCX2931001.1 sirohydrochlorin chelatase [Mycobacterium pinniadriaticum]MCX2937425.1 sirohydrochlorin chelatase [Mycobacterium pinniadriaticum]